MQSSLVNVTCCVPNGDAPAVWITLWPIAAVICSRHLKIEQGDVSSGKTWVA